MADSLGGSGNHAPRTLACGVGLVPLFTFLKPNSSTSGSLLSPTTNMPPEIFVTRPFSFVTTRSDLSLSLLGQFRAACPGLPQSKHARCSSGSGGLVHSLVLCLPPQLPHLTSLLPVASGLGAGRRC